MERERRMKKRGEMRGVDRVKERERSKKRVWVGRATWSDGGKDDRERKVGRDKEG